ncbi:hypothetical protein IGI04_034335, partial [Brassica rapa subsp. trilocularis]
YTTQKPCKESSRLLDLLPGNYTLNSFKNQHYSCKTCILRRSRVAVSSDVELNSQNFHIGLGAILEPCGERLVVVRKILRSNWSDINYNNNDLSAYRLVTPVSGGAKRKF